MAESQPLTDDDRADVVAYLDGELDADAQQRVEARLNADPAARTEADTLKRAWDLLDYLPRSEPALDFTERTLERISSLQVSTAARASRSGARWDVAPWYRRPVVRWCGWAAAALIALVAGYSLGPTKSPEVDQDAAVIMTERPRVIEHLPLYLAAENLDYLLALDQSDLFADDAAGR